MIKANELRIGNWSMLEGEPCYITASHIKEVELDELQLTPMPLTEEWLLRLFFEYKKDYPYSDGSTSDRWILNEGRYFIVRGYENKFSLCRKAYHDGLTIEYLNTVEYVHQLQNLYFALTGKEFKCLV